METFAHIIIGIFLGAGITLWTQWACDRAERVPGADDKQQISDSEYL